MKALSLIILSALLLTACNSNQLAVEEGGLSGIDGSDDVDHLPAIADMVSTPFAGAIPLVDRYLNYPGIDIQGSATWPVAFQVSSTERDNFLNTKEPLYDIVLDGLEVISSDRHGAVVKMNQVCAPADDACEALNTYVTLVYRKSAKSLSIKWNNQEVAFFYLNNNDVGVQIDITKAKLLGIASVLPPDFTTMIQTMVDSLTASIELTVRKDGSRIALEADVTQLKINANDMTGAIDVPQQLQLLAEINTGTHGIAESASISSAAGSFQYGDWEGSWPGSLTVNAKIMDGVFYSAAVKVSSVSIVNLGTPMGTAVLGEVSLLNNASHIVLRSDSATRGVPMSWTDSNMNISLSPSATLTIDKSRFGTDGICIAPGETANGSIGDGVVTSPINLDGSVVGKDCFSM